MLRTIARRDVLDLQASLAKTPAVANNTVAILGAMFNYATVAEVYTGPNPCARLKKLPLPARRKSLKREEYAALGMALARAQREGLPVPTRLRDGKRGMSRRRRAALTGRKRGPYERRKAPRPIPANPTTVDALRFLALSGWREREGLGLRWDAVDFDRGVAVLSDTKTGRSVRPLGEAAIRVVSARPKELDNPFVFPGLRAGSHLQDAKRVWLAVKEAAGVDCRLHDLRHSFTTVGREQGFSDYIIAKLVGHAVGGMTGRYGNVPDATVKRAADVIAATIAERMTESA
jgi:integrase